MPSPTDPWARLADLLITRRVQLNPRWANRKTFCLDTGTEYRIISDLENASRTNYGRATIARIETVYRWEHGSVAAVLDGGDPTPVEQHTEPDDPLKTLHTRLDALEERAKQLQALTDDYISDAREIIRDEEERRRRGA